jgi:hypothetical protein
MVEGKVDKVKIKSLNGYDPTDLIFRSGTGLTYNFNASALSITLPGGAAGDGQDIYIYSRSKGDSVVGRLLVANYPTVTKKVVFVTVGDPTTWRTKPTFSVATVKTEVEGLLNTSYNRIGIGYTIELDNQTLKTNNSWDTNGDGMVQDSRSGFLDNGFTGEEKKLTNLYYDLVPNLDTTKAYLFFTPDGKLTTGDLQGKMPRGRKGGFIFMNNSNLATVAKTVAHELAHGPHTLAHIFNSDWLGTDADQSNAANLMAYNSGVDLIKYQWDIMHDPGVVLGFFEKDRDAQNNSTFSADWKAVLASNYRVIILLNPSELDTNMLKYSIQDVLYSGHGVKNIQMPKTFLSKIKNGILVINNASDFDSIKIASSLPSLPSSIIESEVNNYIGNYIIKSNDPVINNSKRIIPDAKLSSLNLADLSKFIIKVHQKTNIILDTKSANEQYGIMINVFQQMESEFDNTQISNANSEYIRLTNGKVYPLSDDLAVSKKRKLLVINGEKGVIIW